MGEERAIAAINHSVGNGYTGLYEPKGQSNKTTTTRPAVNTGHRKSNTEEL